MNKEKSIFLQILIVIVSVLLVNEYVEDYQMGDSNEREEILTAVMWEIKNSDLKNENIKRIHVEKSSRSFQYKYAVVIDFHDGNYLVYEWADQSKKSIKKSEHSSI